MTPARRGPTPPRWVEAWGDPLGPAAAGWVGTALFLVLVAVVAFHDLGARSLHTLDLPRFGVLAREMLRPDSGDWLVPMRYGEPYVNKPPLHVWLVAAPAALVGEVTPFLVRLPSALGLVLMVLATSAWGRLRGGSTAHGRAAALLLLGTYAITRFGREGRPDMLASGLVVAAAYLLDRMALGRGRRADAWTAGILLGLALLAKGPVPLLFPALVVLLPSSERSTRERLRAVRPVLVLGVAFALAGLWLGAAVAKAGWGYADALLVRQATDRLEGRAPHTEAWWYYALRLLDGGAPWTPLYLAALLLLPARRPLRDARSLVAAAGVSLLVFSTFPTKHLRYVLPVFAFLALAVGHLLAPLMRGGGGTVWTGVHRIGAALAALVAVAGVLAAASGRVPALAAPGALGALLVPASGLLLLGVAALLAPADDARRRLLGSLLVGVALALVAYWAVRDRHRVRSREAFDLAVARAAPPALPVWTVHPVEPGHVFHGAPHARLARHAADLPTATDAPHLLVLVLASGRDEAERARGAAAGVLLEAPMGDNWPVVQLLRFAPP